MKFIYNQMRSKSRRPSSSAVAFIQEKDEKDEKDLSEKENIGVEGPLEKDGEEKDGEKDGGGSGEKKQQNNNGEKNEIVFVENEIYNFIPPPVVVVKTVKPDPEYEMKYPPINHIKSAIENNDPIDNILHVIAVISNPGGFKKRVQLMKDFLHRMELETHVIVYVVEMVYGNQEFSIIDVKNTRHLGLRTITPIWHKENMINLGVYYLLPKDWKAFAWIDADIEFENPTWALDTLKILNGCSDVVQLFSHAVDMDKINRTMNIFNSFGFQYSKGLAYSSKYPDYWHPGYAWACTKKAYQKMGKLFDLAILGSADFIMAHCFLNKGFHVTNKKFSHSMNQAILEFEERVKRLRLGYVPGVIRHHFHGSKANRKYIQRNDIIYKYHYDPSSQISVDSLGILIPTKHFQMGFKNEIFNYFLQRNEDE
jgi:hypothetical protein